MKLITERSQIRDVAERWGRQYPSDTMRKDQYAKLRALDPETATASDVAKIIGNNSWVGPIVCDQCGGLAPVAVQVGQEPDYDSRTATLCPACLYKALQLLADARADAED